MKTVVGLYDHFEEAQSAVGDLRSAGFRSEDISLVARDGKGEYSRSLGETGEHKNIADGAATGAGVGAVLGGLGGLLVGLGALAIPGVGPVLAAGPLVAALAGAGVGAVAGGIVGALVDLGIPEEHAQYYAEGLRRGGTLLALRTDDGRADEAMNIMNRYHPIDVSRRAEEWRQRDNWSQYDPSAQPLTDDQLEFNRTGDRMKSRLEDKLDYPATGATHYVESGLLDRPIPGSGLTNRDVLGDMTSGKYIRDVDVSGSDPHNDNNV